MMGERKVRSLLLILSIVLVLTLSIPVLGGGLVASAQKTGSNGEVRAFLRTHVGTNQGVADENAAFIIDLPERRLVFFFDGQTVCGSNSLVVNLGFRFFKTAILPDGTVIEGSTRQDMVAFSDGLVQTFEIDGTDLRELTRQQRTPVTFNPHSITLGDGTIIDGSFGFSEGGTFKRGELLDLIGPGAHDLRIIIDSTSPGNEFFADIPSTFSLDSTC